MIYLCCLRFLRCFLKSGPSSNLRRKNDGKWVKMAGPESLINTLLIIKLKITYTKTKIS